MPKYKLPDKCIYCHLEGYSGNIKLEDLEDDFEILVCCYKCGAIMITDADYIRKYTEEEKKTLLPKCFKRKK